MEKLKKFAVRVLILWIVIFIIFLFTFSTWNNAEIWELFILSFMVSMGISSVIESMWKPSQHHAKSAPHSKTLYVFKGEFDKTLICRIENNRIYPGTSNKFEYEIKGDKICFAGSAKFLYRIQNNRLYKPGTSQVSYKLENNRVYEGELGRVPLYRITNSRIGNR